MNKRKTNMGLERTVRELFIEEEEMVTKQITTKPPALQHSVYLITASSGHSDHTSRMATLPQ